MILIEKLNKILAKKKEVYEAQRMQMPDIYQTFVNPSNYKGTVLKHVGGTPKVLHDDQEEYFKDLLESFLLNTHLYRAGEWIQGQDEARKSMGAKYGYGAVDDVYYRVGNQVYRFRILIKGEQGARERMEMTPNYITLRSIDDLYNWYVSKFGEIDL